jgi:hypothetical protein
VTGIPTAAVAVVSLLTAVASLDLAVAQEATRSIEEGPGTPAKGTKTFEVEGVLQADYVQDFKRVDRNWDDTLRPSRIPTQKGQFGSDGHASVSARQSGFGFNAAAPVAGHELHARFYFDLFGSGNNEGETTFHLEHAYAEWGQWLAGRTDTVFMDADIIPNVIDFWGPPGIIYVRNAQIRWTPIHTDRYRFAIAIEKPADDIDPGQIRVIDPALGENLQSDEKVPDLTVQLRLSGESDHIQIAGLLRRVGVETLGTPNNEPRRSKVGGGVNVTSTIKLSGSGDALLLGAVYGKGIASYLNDGGTDLAPGGTPEAPVASAVPLWGVSAYYNHRWSKSWTSSIGYGRTQVNNRSLQEADAFKFGEYSSVNLLWSPADELMMGAEALWGRREDKDGHSGDDERLQFTIRYSFSAALLTASAP